MAILRWRGDAPAVAQETRATPANVEAGDVFALTINGKAVSYVATAATVANVTAGLAAAWNASRVPEHAEVMATDQGTYVQLVGNTAGAPFTLSASTTNGGGSNTQTLTLTTPTAASGPNFWSVAANWSTGTVPATGDQVMIEDSQVPILYGLDQHTVTLASLQIAQSFAGTIGLPRTHGAGSAAYVEYRDEYLRIGATEVRIGHGSGNGAPRIKLDTGSGQTTLNILGSGTAAESSLPAILWKGTHAANGVQVTRGSFGAAVQADELATIAVLRVGYRQNVLGDAAVLCGAGTTLDSLQIAGGSIVIHAATDSVEMSDGDLTLLADSHTSLALVGGVCHYQGAGTIGAASIGGGALLDFSRDLRARTLSTCTLMAGGALADPMKTVTFTAGILLPAATLAAVRLDVGADRTLQIS